MSDVNAQIKIAVDAAQAQAELKALQAQITALNASMASQRKAKGIRPGHGKCRRANNTDTNCCNKSQQRLAEDEPQVWF